eukprot:EG_transcript_5339
MAGPPAVGARLPRAADALFFSAPAPPHHRGAPLLRHVEGRCRVYVPAAVNGGRACRLVFGVQEDGLVEGLPLSFHDRDTVGLALDGIWCDLQPQADPRSYEVRFIALEGSAGLWLVQISVYPEATLPVYLFQGKATTLSNGKLVALPHGEVARRRAAMDDESAQLAAECLDCYAAKLRRYPPVSTFRLWVIGARTHAGKLSQLAHGKGSRRMAEFLLGCRTAQGAQFLCRVVRAAEELPEAVEAQLAAALRPCPRKKSSVPAWVLGWPPEYLPDWVPHSQENLIVWEVAVQRIQHDKDTTWVTGRKTKRRELKLCSLFDTTYIGPSASAVMTDEDLNTIYNQSKAAALERQYSPKALKWVKGLESGTRSADKKAARGAKPEEATANWRTEHVKEVPALEVNTFVPVEEGVHYEFKPFGLSSEDPFKSCGGVAAQYISAFLNSVGGVLLFGVTDDGCAQGAAIDIRQRGKIQAQMTNILRRFRPPPARRLLRIRFVSVVPQGSLASPGKWWEVEGEAQVTRDHCVLEISVLKGSHAVYFHSPWSTMCNVRMGNSNRMMTEGLMVRRIAQELRREEVRRLTFQPEVEAPPEKEHGELTLEAVEALQRQEQRKVDDAAEAEIRALEAELAAVLKRVDELRRRLRGEAGPQAAGRGRGVTRKTPPEGARRPLVIIEGGEEEEDQLHMQPLHGSPGGRG